jgi:predicted nucleic-acid-binding Zn-ribbon protein
MKRCPKCRKKNTLVDIVSGPVKINPFTIRSYIGVQCISCSWSEKTYTFKDVEEGKQGKDNG